LNSRAKPKCALIILAAGGSARLGRPKQLVSFRGRSLLRRAAQTALASDCRPVIVVLGAFARRLKGELGALPLTVATNLQWGLGIGSSIRAGLAALPPGRDAPDAVVIMLCDQPLISARFLNRLLAVHHSSRRGIVASEYAGTVGVPALFSRAYYPELAALAADSGAKAVIVKHEKDLERIPLAEAAFDLDRPEDMRRMRDYSGAKFAGWSQGAKNEKKKAK
jgi:molybdenum cofactor cytidylyltransferase